MTEPKDTNADAPLQNTVPLGHPTVEAKAPSSSVDATADADAKSDDASEAEDSDGGGGDCDQTIAFAIRPSAATGAQLYTPVIIALFGDMKPERRVIEQDELIIGRSSSCDLSISDDAASRRHARLHYTNCGNNEARPLIHIYDMGSRNGVYVNGQRVVTKMLLHDNARISIGETQIGFYVLSFPKKAIGGDKPADAPAAAPDAAPAPAAVADKAAAPRAAAPQAPPPARRIAVIDNDFNFATELRQQLDATGRYHTVVYRGLDNAIRNFDVNPPAMILLDADLPEGDTAALCAKLKAHEQWKGIPIILFFDTLDPDRVRAALKAGAQSYLKKPIDNLSLLTNRIDIHINVNAMMSSIGQGTRR